MVLLMKGDEAGQPLRELDDQLGRGQGRLYTRERGRLLQQQKDTVYTVRYILYTIVTVFS